MHSVPQFLQLHQGTSLDALALWPGSYVPGSHRTVTIREMALGRLPSPGYCIDNRLKHLTSISVKETCLLILQLWLVRQASSLAYT